MARTETTLRPFAASRAMIDIGHLASHPIALLAAAVVVLWVARMLANLAFKIVLVLAVVGAVAVAGGAKVPAGLDLKGVASGLESGLGEAVAIAGTLWRAAENKVEAKP